MEENTEKYSTLAPRKKNISKNNKDTADYSSDEVKRSSTVTENQGEKEEKTPKKSKIRWLKENKKAVILGTIFLLLLIGSILGALYLHNRTFENPETPEEKENVSDTKVYTEDKTVSGSEIKKLLLSWKEEDNFAIVVGTKQLLLDKCSYDISYLKYLTDERTVAYSADINEKTYNLKCINYGNCFESGMLSRDGSGFFFYGSILDESITYQGHDDEGNDALIVGMKKSNPWDEEKGIEIKDEEMFFDYELYDSEGRTVGVVFITTGL